MHTPPFVSRDSGGKDESLPPPPDLSRLSDLFFASSSFPHLPQKFYFKPNILLGEPPHPMLPRSEEKQTNYEPLTSSPRGEQQHASRWVLSLLRVKAHSKTEGV